MTRAHLAGIILVMTAPLLSGCVTSSDTSSGSCPGEIRFEGAKYTQYRAGQVETGRSLGQIELTPCNDQSEGSGGDVPFEILEIVGTSTNEAIAAKMGGSLVVFVSSAVEEPCKAQYTNCG